jgi:membrane peptidoglycan carboxypeptidase
VSAAWTARYAKAFTAIWLDLRLGKDEVLTRYLNAVYLGAGAYGMSAAARLYFDKSLADLTLPEAALLVGLIQAPSRYDPFETSMRRIAGAALSYRRHARGRCNRCESGREGKEPGPQR